MDYIIEYLYIIPAALIAIVLHEFAHALMSHILGDPTPKQYGRLSLNPIKHLDIVGTLSLILFHFGWAKPVMIDTSYYKKPRLGTTIVSLAGPLMNFILVTISFLVLGLILKIQVNNGLFDNTVLNIIYKFFSYLAIVNIGFGIFNLIPIPPLDGSKIIGIILPKKAYDEYMSYQRYGIYFMIGFLILITVIETLGYPSPVGMIIDKVFDWFAEITTKIFF